MQNQSFERLRPWIHRSACALFAAHACGFSHTAFAATPDVDIQELRTMIKALQGRSTRSHRLSPQKRPKQFRRQRRRPAISFLWA